MLVKLVCRYAGLSFIGLSFFANVAVAQDEITNGGTVTNKEPFPVSFQEAEDIPEDFHRQEVPYATTYPPGTLVIDTDSRFLYLVLPEGQAIRYGIGVGREGFEWSGKCRDRPQDSLALLVSPQSHGRARSICPQMGEECLEGQKILSVLAPYICTRTGPTRFIGYTAPTSQAPLGRRFRQDVCVCSIPIIELYDRVSEGTKVVVIATPRKTTTVARAMPRKQKLRKIVRREPKLTFAFYQRSRLAKVRSDAATKKMALKPKLVRKTNFNLNKLKLTSSQ